MNRLTPLNTTLQTLSASLYPTEQILIYSDSVGLYDGKEKDPSRYEGRLYLTSHRIVFVEKEKPHKYSVYLALNLVKQTEYYVGFLKSSPKITLLLHPTEEEEEDRDDEGVTREVRKVERGGGWVCRVCGMSNVPSLELGYKCSLCGIPADPATTSNSNSNPSKNLPSSCSPPIPPLPSSDYSSSAQPTLNSPKSITCQICTFNNHHSMSRCEMCDSPLPTSSSRPPSTSATTTPLSTPRSSTPVPTTSTSTDEFVRLSFRKGGSSVFYTQLKEALVKKGWEMGVVGRKESTGGINGGKGKGGRLKEVEGNDQGLKRNSSGVGIDAILRGIDLTTQTREDSLDTALRDLDSLMSSAKEMIQLAQSLSSQSSSKNPQATDTLNSLGLLTSTAVTSDQSTSQKEYHHSLAQELASLLQPRGGKAGVLEKKGGIIGLDELWCIWNRARGIALVSPKSLMLSVPYLAQYTSPPLTPLTFPSGLTILHTPRYDPTNFSKRFLSYLDEQGEGEGMGVVELARKEGISLGLGKELVELVEMGEGGGVVRDNQAGGGIRWFRDYLTGWEWDGQT